MEERGLRQVDIVRMCEPLCSQHGVKISRAGVCQYLSGRNNPSRLKLAILSEVLDVDVAWLSGLSDQKEMDKQWSDEAVTLVEQFDRLSEEDKCKVMDYIGKLS